MASLPSLWNAMVSSRVWVTSPSAMKYAVSVGVISMVARRTIPVSPLPPTVAQNSSASSPSGVSVADLPVGGQQLHRPDVVAEAARAVVVLAVDVGGDGAADGDLPGAGQHRHPQPERQRGPHQLIEVDAGVEVGDVGVGVDRVDPVQRRHVDDQPAAVLRVVAVGAAQPAGDDAAAAGVGGVGDRFGDHLRVRCGQHLRHRWRGAAPAGQPLRGRGRKHQ